MRTSLILLKRAFKSSSNTEFNDESSYDKWEASYIPTDRNDHSCLCIKKNVAEPLIFKKLNEQVIEVEKSANEKIVNASEKVPVETSSIFKENIIPQNSLTSNLSEQSAPLPIKKKRGRKPGSKCTIQAAKRPNTKHQTYYSPTLKNPGKYPDLIHFKDDNDRIYLRNTSRDVMLSSTLPFQETPEFLELKEMYLRLCNQRRMI